MKFIGHVLAFLLATVLALSVSSWVLDHTLWNAKYVESRAEQAGLYPSLATALPKAFAAADPEAGASGLTNLNPSLIKDQATTLLPAFIEHLHNAGPAPTLDLAALAKAFGQPAPEGATTQTITLGDADARITGLSQNLHTAGQYAPLGALALILLIAGVMRTRRFPTLARAAIETAVALGFAAGLFWLLPSFILQALNKPTLTPIRDAVSPFASALCHGIASQFGIAALVFVAAALALWFVHGATRLKAKFTREPKAPKMPPPAAGSGRL